MYEKLLKPILFRFDPEHVHDFFVALGETLGNCAPARAIVGAACRYEHPSLRTRVAGIDFENPVGLGAGFDKDVRLTRIMPAVGFGFMEVGAITHHPYDGNPGKRLARLPADQSLIVYYGLKNIGAAAISEKLQKMMCAPKPMFKIPTGINIAKTNRADIKGEKSVEDYVATYRLLAPYFAYATLNISCPNAQDGCTFQDPAMLDGLLAALAREEKPCPVFLKLSTHLTIAETDAILAVVEKRNAAFESAARRPGELLVDGFIVGNLSKRRDILHFNSPPEKLNAIPQGGISGRPVRELSTHLIRHLYRKTAGRYVLIGLGGIFTAEDAYEKIKAGASLVQIVTGLIYGGPMAVKRMNRGLVELLQRDGYKNISEAVGKEK